MPVSEHYEGHGDKVARSMKRTYGKNWKRVFYATENKRKGKRKKSLKR